MDSQTHSSKEGKEGQIEEGREGKRKQARIV